MYHLNTQENQNGAKQSLLGSGADTNTYISPIQQYNHVIQCYNADENQIESTQLDEMEDSMPFNLFWRVFSNPYLLLISLLVIMIPYMGVIVYLWMLFSGFIYFHRLMLFKKNAKKVADPCSKMVFCPELCRMINVTNKSYEIKIQGKITVKKNIINIFLRFGRVHL